MMKKKNLFLPFARNYLLIHISVSILFLKEINYLTSLMVQTGYIARVEILRLHIRNLDPTLYKQLGCL